MLSDSLPFPLQLTDSLQAYKFKGIGKVEHYFCATCGSSCMARSVTPGFFEGITCVNVRLIEGVDPDALKYKEYDGASYDNTAVPAE